MPRLTSATPPLVRETAIAIQGLPLVVELHPGFVVVRRKGCKVEKYMVPWDAVYSLGAKMAERGGG
jgi:hypothetical protein